MVPNTRDEKRKIFRQELFTLKEEGYLSDAIVDTVAKAHHQYHLDLLESEAIQQESEISIPIQPKVAANPPKVKKSLTPEEIRERNITWSLNIGVIFLLIGGLFVATSNWESMTSFMKSGSIAIVALVFYGIAFLAKRILHIDKTAFAFIVLGSLFLPIFILSLGWFGLLGSYLSIYGEGRFLLGMLGSFLPIIIYIIFAKNLSSRLFVWFTYVSFSAGMAFLLAGVKLEIDFFYLGMMIFNGVLILVYHRIKKTISLELFTKEFVPYVQVNLVICTLFMLLFFNNEVIYSFNLLLTGIIYLSMMYVSGKKEYHFIFSVLIVYGAYQLIEHSFLTYFGEIVYALVGFGIMFVPNALDGKFKLEKVFQYTSAVISGFAFIYISLEGILLRAGEASIVLMLAYFIIAANFVYLSYNSPRWLFPYLSSVFVATGIYEAISFFTQWLFTINVSLALSVTGFIILTVFGLTPLSKYLTIIQNACRDVGLAIMGVAMLVALALFFWWELGVILLLLVVASYFLYKKEKRILLQGFSVWILPSSLGLSVVAFGEELCSNSTLYYEEYGYAVNFAAGAFLVLLSRFVWNSIGEMEINIKSLYVATVLYTIAIFHAFINPINELWVQPLVLVAGIGMYGYLYKKVQTNWIPYTISVTTLLAYFSIIHAINESISFSIVVDSLIPSISSVLLLVIAYLCRIKDRNLASAFFLTGHILFPLTLGFTLIAYQSDASFSFMVATLVYALSTRVALREWVIKVSLYACFLSLFIVVSTGLNTVLNHNYGLYEFPITSGIIFIFILLTNELYKKRTMYFFVPFSIIGVTGMLSTYPFDLVPFLVTCVYVILLVFYLHKIQWDILGAIPLFLAFVATVEFVFLTEMDVWFKMLVVCVLGILMNFCGQMIYKKLFEYGKTIQIIKLDGYTLVSLLYFGCMYFLENQFFWGDALPGILIALTLWIQRRRVPSSVSYVMSILGGIYLLQPYYAIIDELNITPLWDREVHVLPFIVLVIFIRKTLKGRFSDITKIIQWAVLIIVSILLIQDGLTSNTIYDAIIIGSLSLLSMIAGMFLQIKSYFFVGAGVLLLNVFLQTRPYWGNMPWWFYLLITGLILITIASFNEWHKQKVQKGESTFITFLKKRVIDKIKQWD
ncbi:hypothetical protein AA0X95_13315 [Bacillus sp. 1P10SD]|uniref:hypothetical protein n=1 Tax=Bacillus sp. 1P10SD TaxID=3132265 RepID=UPI0039A69EEC